MADDALVSVAPPPEPILPEDIFRLICAELASRGYKKTLLNTMLCSRDLCQIGVRYLVEELAPLGGNRGPLPSLADIDKWARFVLFAAPNNWLQFVDSLLLEWACYHYFTFSPVYDQIVWQAVAWCNNITRLEIRMTERNSSLYITIPHGAAAKELPRPLRVSLRYVEVTLMDERRKTEFDLSPFWTALAGLPRLGAWSLRGLPDQSLSNFHHLVAVLESLALIGGRFERALVQVWRLFRVSTFSPNKLSLNWRDLHNPHLDAQGAMYKAFVELTGISHLTLEAVPTIHLLRGLPNVDILEIVCPFPNLLADADSELLLEVVDDDDSVEDRQTALFNVINDSTFAVLMDDYPPCFSPESGCKYGHFTQEEAEVWTTVVEGMAMPEVLDVWTKEWSNKLFGRLGKFFKNW